MITIYDKDGGREYSIESKDCILAETDCIDFYEWIVNAIQEKLRRVLDRIVLEYTNLNPAKMSKEEKLSCIASVPLKSGREKNVKEEAKLEEQLAGKANKFKYTQERTRTSGKRR